MAEWNWQISPRCSEPQPRNSSQPSFCAKHRCRRSGLMCHAQVWHLFQRGVSGQSEDAKTPLCTTWRYGFARSWRDLSIGVAKGGACWSGFLFGQSSRFGRPSWCARARGDATTRRTGPPRNMWCFGVVVRVAACEREIAKTERRNISRDELTKI